MIDLRSLDTLPTASISKEDSIELLEYLHKRLFDLQDLFYADSRFALLIIFQGVDTSGKDGTIRHVLSAMNPMGIHVQPFKKPTEEEASHDFLWRVYRHFPAKGMIQVFNRSYYEDILVPTVNGLLSKEELGHRVETINHLESHLQQSGTHILKFFLNISKKEQQHRIKDRLAEPKKNWKYSPEDQLVADRWDDYLEANSMALSHCASPKWHIVPSDKRWFRNYTVAKIVVDYLEALHLKYPQVQVPD